MRASKRLCVFLKARRASAAIEFAIVVPIMLFFVGGIVEFGRAYQAYNAVNQIVTRYALAYADCNDYPVTSCKTELNLYYTTLPAMQNLAPQLTNTSSLVLRMFQVSVQYPAATVSVTYSSGYPSVPTTLLPSEITAAQAAVTVDASIPQTPQTGVVVTLTYVHPIVFFQTIAAKLGLANRTITYTVAQKKS